MNQLFSQYHFSVADRFMRYVQIDTQSDPHSKTFPSTEKQKDLLRLLVEELKEIGIQEVEMDEFGYVYATIPANVEPHISVPVICFCAHVDTAPDCSGTNVKPIIHWKYDGRDLELPDDPAQVIRQQDHPYLLERIGDDIITASGTTLLGADDKAGVAIIMDLAQFLMEHPSVKHGKIRLLFTPDEEIGHGVNHVDIDKLGAYAGYTLDAGERGSFEEETFSADAATITFHGVSAHPGYAKNKLVNAIKAAGKFLQLLPQDKSPETTEGRAGFIHPVHVEGTAEKATVQLIVRDFETAQLTHYHQIIEEAVAQVNHAFPGLHTVIEKKEQYRNMKDVLVNHPEISAYAREAIQRAGITLKESSARGGTDGSRLSFMGLPCPNLFTGEMAFHGKHEYVSIQDMQKSVETLAHLASIWAENAGQKD